MKAVKLFNLCEQIGFTSQMSNEKIVCAVVPFLFGFTISHACFCFVHFERICIRFFPFFSPLQCDIARALLSEDSE